MDVNSLVSRLQVTKIKSLRQRDNRIGNNIFIETLEIIKLLNSNIEMAATTNLFVAMYFETFAVSF